jgi:hypothetical protein
MNKNEIVFPVPSSVSELRKQVSGSKGFSNG